MSRDSGGMMWPWAQAHGRQRQFFLPAPEGRNIQRSKPVASKHQFTGMTGLYLVAAELSKRSFIVSPTSRSAHTADLLITDALCQETYAVQVKTNASTFNFWLVSAKTSRIKSKNFVYVFVNLRRSGPEFYVVSSKVVAAKVRVDQPSKTRKTVWYSVYLKDIAQFKDRWDTFENEAALRDTNANF